MKSQKAASGRLPYIYVLPVIVLLTLVIVYPMLYAVLLSFGRFGSRLDFHFVGLDNFRRVLARAQFWVSARNSLVFTGVSVLCQTLLGFCIALLLNHRSLPCKKLFRVIFVIPWTVTPVIVATIWVWMYNPQHGIINEILVRFGLIKQYVPWLGLPGKAMAAAIATNTWRGTPFVMLGLLAGLQAIPQEQYEAARVDGANSLELFYYVTLPNLRTVLSVLVVLNTIWNFKLFDIIYVMTGGGPAGTTEILPTLIYRTAFENGNFGEAASVAVMMFIGIVFIVACYLRMVTDAATGRGS